MYLGRTRVVSQDSGTLWDRKLEGCRLAISKYKEVAECEGSGTEEGLLAAPCNDLRATWELRYSLSLFFLNLGGGMITKS